MRRHLATVLICLAVALVAQNAPNDWKEYSYATDGFAVTAPSSPSFSKQNKETPGGSVEVHNYAIELGNNSGVMISSTQIPGAEKAPPKPLLQKAKEGAVGAMGAKITSEKEISLDSFPGIEFVAESENFHLRARMYIVKEKLLSLLAIAPKDTALPPGSDRILDSLKLLKAPAEK